jgi:1,4-alpha-glucan branching enzyme
MNKKKKSKPASDAPSSHCVCLEFIHPPLTQASEVCIAGSFNDWHPSVTPMIRVGEGKWAKELTLPPGRYEYRFVVDGQCVDDPAAKETVPNPHGGVNAVLIVPPA